MRNGKKNGFTLIELMVVVMIVTLLAAIAYPRYFSSLERSRYAVIRHNLFIMRNSIMHFYDDQGSYPQALQDLVDYGYLREIPSDPTTGKNDIWVPVFENSGGGIIDVQKQFEP